MKCERCGKDLTEAVRVLAGDDPVRIRWAVNLHQLAHFREDQERLQNVLAVFPKMVEALREACKVNQDTKWSQWWGDVLAEEENVKP